MSHLWERFTRANNVAWDHEKSSLELLDLIIEGKLFFDKLDHCCSNLIFHSSDNNIDISEYGLSPQDLDFIKEIIGKFLKDKSVFNVGGRGSCPLQ